MFLQLLSEKFPILRRTEQDIFKTLRTASCKVPVILFRFELNLIFLDRCWKNTRISNLMKFRPVGAEFSSAARQAEWRTD
jgi:hypothetical protein